MEPKICYLFNSSSPKKSSFWFFKFQDVVVMGLGGILSAFQRMDQLGPFLIWIIKFLVGIVLLSQDYIYQLGPVNNNFLIFVEMLVWEVLVSQHLKIMHFLISGEQADSVVQLILQLTKHYVVSKNSHKSLSKKVRISFALKIAIG